MKFSEMKYERPSLDEAKKELSSLIAHLENAASYEEAKKVFLEKETFTKHVETMGTLASIRHSIDTRDEFYDAEVKFFNAAGPELQEYFQKWTEAMLKSPFTPDFEQEYGDLMFKNAARKHPRNAAGKRPYAGV